MAKILIFYSKTGGGHFRAAEAIASEIKQLSPKTQVVLYDGLEKTNFGVSINSSFSYSVISNYLLFFYNLIYRLTNNPLGLKILRGLIKNSWGNYYKAVIEKEKPDLIISTHHFITKSTLFKLKRCPPFIIVVTDLGKPHLIWFDKKADLIIVPTQNMANFAKKSLGLTQISALGYPLTNSFKPLPQLKHFSNTLLVLGGGLGSGNLKQQVLALLKHFKDKRVIAICGYNKPLLHSLSKINNPNLQTFGFVDNFSELAKDVDIIISKAGPAAIVESITLNKPLIITSWVGLQEKENINFVVENKLGVYNPQIKKLLESINFIYQNYPTFINKDNLISVGTLDIAKTVLQRLHNFSQDDRMNI